MVDIASIALPIGNPEVEAVVCKIVSFEQETMVIFQLLENEGRGDKNPSYIILKNGSPISCAQTLINGSSL